MFLQRMMRRSFLPFANRNMGTPASSSSSSSSYCPRLWSSTIILKNTRNIVSELECRVGFLEQEYSQATAKLQRVQQEYSQATAKMQGVHKDIALSNKLSGLLLAVIVSDFGFTIYRNISKKPPSSSS